MSRKCVVVNQPPDYLTIDEAAEHYRTTADTMRYWRHLGQGPVAVKPGTKLLYPASEIRRYDEELLSEARQQAAERSPTPREADASAFALDQARTRLSRPARRARRSSAERT